MGKKIVTVIVIALVVFLLVWRLWPHSFFSMIPVDSESIASLSCNASVSGIENGEVFIKTYALNALSSQDAEFGRIMEILNSTDYRQDYRNILPWSIMSAGSDKTHNGQSVSVLLVWGNEESKSCYIVFHSDRIVSVAMGAESGLRVYHPTNRETLGTLTEYLQAYGNET